MSRVAADWWLFGGPGDRRMTGLLAGGRGLVAVGRDASGGDADATVWTSADGLRWSRVSHDDEVFGGSGEQAMSTAAVRGPDVVGGGYAGEDPAAGVGLPTE